MDKNLEVKMADDTFDQYNADVYKKQATPGWGFHYRSRGHQHGRQGRSRRGKECERWM